MGTSPRIPPPDRTRIVDRVFHSIEQEILTGRIRPGVRLVEQTLCEQMGVSRTTVREALLMLERDGLVQSTPRGGTFVVHLSLTAARDISTMRALLEGYAVRVAFPTYNEALRTALQDLKAQMNAASLPEGVPHLIDLDLAFHRLIVEQAHSENLMELWTRLNGKLRALYLLYIEHFGVTAPSHISTRHDSLVTDLFSGDVERAQRAVMSHYMVWVDAETDAQTLARILDPYTG